MLPEDRRRGLQVVVSPTCSGNSAPSKNCCASARAAAVRRTSGEGRSASQRCCRLQQTRQRIDALADDVAVRRHAVVGRRQSQGGAAPRPRRSGREERHGAALLPVRQAAGRRRCATCTSSALSPAARRPAGRSAAHPGPAASALRRAGGRACQPRPVRCGRVRPPRSGAAPRTGHSPSAGGRRRYRRASGIGAASVSQSHRCPGRSFPIVRLPAVKLFARKTAQDARLQSVRG